MKKFMEMLNMRNLIIASMICLGVSMLDAIFVSDIVWDGFNNLTWWVKLFVLPALVTLVYIFGYVFLYGMIYLNLKKWFIKS